MATPLSASAALSALKKAGLTIVEMGNWKNHNRNHKGAWGPVNGVMIHHTGSDTSSPKTYAKNILVDGYSTLPGPLCQSGIDKDGKVYMTGWGRANHAGGGDGSVLNKVIAESYSSLKPTKGNSNGVDGNSRFYGVEVMYSGGHPMAKAQRAAAVTWAAALCHAHGWTEKSVIGHGEWSSDKWDPGKEDMDDFRADVKKEIARLKGGSNEPPKADPIVSKPSKPATSKPSTSKPTVDLSDLVKAARSNPSRRDQKVTYAGTKHVENALVKEGLLSKTYADGHFGTTTVIAYAKWQKRLGYRGRDADGIPGEVSLKKLGDKHGFSVKK